ncbi:MAG: hypothetical protein E6Q67_03125 [Roseateles sp.]|nr:MAG: hypothetical protein E6Q67_03125 [Roseateles sp.]
MADHWNEATGVPHDLSLHTGEDGIDGRDSLHDGEVLEHEAVVSEAPAPNKRGRGARIAVLGLGVVVIGFVGMTVMKVLSGGHSQVEVVEAAPEAHAAGATGQNGGDALLAAAQQQAGGAAGMLGDAASAPSAAFPMASSASEPAPSASSPSPATSAATAIVQAASLQQPVQPQPAAATAPASDSRVSSLEQRMDKVEGRVDDLARNKAAGKAKDTSTASEGKPATKLAKEHATRRHVSAKGKDFKDSKTVVAAKEVKEEVIESNELANYRLQAVYPVQGADARAWVFDGQMVRVVARGDYLGASGAQVVEVQRDKVLTTKGVVR